MRTLANLGELWRTHNTIFTTTSVTFTRVPAKVPHIHQSSGEGAFCMRVAFRMCHQLKKAAVTAFNKEKAVRAHEVCETHRVLQGTAPRERQLYSISSDLPPGQGPLDECFRARARGGQRRGGQHPVKHRWNGVFLAVRKLQNESFPNFSNFRPEFCPEFCSEFFPNFSRTFRASFHGEMETRKSSPKIPAIFQCEIPRQTRKKYSQNSSGEQAK